MNRKAFDLVICSALAAVAMTLALLAPEVGPARALVGLPLVLFAPGYAIGAAAFPAGRLGRIERLLFSLGASLAVAALAGLLLHWTALGLRPAAWAVALGNITMAAARQYAGAARRRHDVGRRWAAGPGAATGRRRGADRPRWCDPAARDRVHAAVGAARQRGAGG